MHFMSCDKSKTLMRPYSVSYFLMRLHLSQNLPLSGTLCGISIMAISHFEMKSPFSLS